LDNSLIPPQQLLCAIVALSLNGYMWPMPAKDTVAADSEWLHAFGSNCHCCALGNSVRAENMAAHCPTAAILTWLTCILL
jgi:hypothetical protein